MKLPKAYCTSTLILKIYATILFGILISSCGSIGNEAAPTLSLTLDNAFSNVDFEPGDFIKLSIQADVPGGVKDVFYNKIIDGNEESATKIIGFTRGDVTFNGTIEVPVTEAVGTVVIIKVSITDNDDQIATTSTAYNVVAPGQGGGGSVPLLSNKVTLVLGAGNDTTGSYLASANGVVYKSNEAKNNQAAIDITLGLDATQQFQLISPDERANQGLEIGTPAMDAPRTTFFKEETDGPSNLDSLKAVDVAENISASTKKNILISANKTYSFVQGGASGKKGYIRVTSINSTVTSQTVTIEYVVQQ